MTARRCQAKPKALDAGLRRKVLERDHHRCRYCGRSDGVDAHHVHLKSQGGPDAVENLITLCRIHHNLVHTRTRYWQPILEFLIAQQMEHGRSLTVLQAERFLRRLGAIA